MLVKSVSACFSTAHRPPRPLTTAKNCIFLQLPLCVRLNMSGPNNGQNHHQPLRPQTKAEIVAQREQVRILGIALGNWREARCDRGEAELKTQTLYTVHDRHRGRAPGDPSQLQSTMRLLRPPGCRLPGWCRSFSLDVIVHLFFKDLEG